MTMHIKTGSDASDLLWDNLFQENWQALYDRCPWATAFQSYYFVSRWYETYRERFDPVILTEVSSSGKELQGLLTLAISRESGQLVIAGAHQAEYHTWLAVPSLASAFIERGLDELRANFPGQVLVFRYLPSLTPRDWLDPSRPWGRYCVLEPHRRPLLDVRDASGIIASLKKSSNRSRFNRLKRLGTVSFEQVTAWENFAEVFDEVIRNYDFRQGALHGSFPFQNDSLKKPFHLALTRSPSILHVTLLKLNSEIIAAHLGVCDKNTVHIGVYAYSPLYAQHSPGKLHLLMLGERMHREGFSTLDLTPGGDWKDQYCSRHDEVYLLRVFLGRKQLMRHQAIAKGEAVARRVLRHTGVSPQSVREGLAKLRRGGLRRLFLPFCHPPLGSLLKPSCQAELRLYTLRADEVSKAEPPQLMAKDSVGDLLLFHQNESLQSRQEFLSQASQWLEEGHHIYTRVEDGRLVHYGWLVALREKVFIQEIQQELHLPPDSAVLLDFYTAPQARARGLCQASLRQMLYDAAAQADVKQIFVYALDDNVAFRHTIEKIGFRMESAPYD